MEKIFKTSNANLRAKVNVIKSSPHKYSVPAMCKVLKISKITYYFEVIEKADESEFMTAIVKTFKSSSDNYGIRKIKL